jgi:hypothetical protein
VIGPLLARASPNLAALLAAASADFETVRR